MSRNAQSMFSQLPDVNISRSTFDRNMSHKTTFNAGRLVPFYIDEVLPGDTHSVTTSKLVRLQTMLTPIMDNIYLDTYYFFVPNRIVWEHWRELMGENRQSAWLSDIEYEVPIVTPPSGGWIKGTIADYLGVPTGIESSDGVSCLPFRAYAKIVDDWFRDQNLQDPVLIPLDDVNVVGVNSDNYITDLVKGGMPFVAAKYHDYFTSCLPAPQKGPDVTISTVGGLIPVVPNAVLHDSSFYPKVNTTFSDLSSNSTILTGGAEHFLGIGRDDGRMVQGESSTAGLSTDSTVAFNNLYADISTLTVATVNQLRMAFQVQKLYEKDARGGTRYIEVLKSHFGVISPDARQQRSEYLGGNRIPINVNQIIQTSESAETPQGTLTGQSYTLDNNRDFTKSFTEHGFVIGVCVARYDHTYQQGLERFWFRRDRLDFYWPVLANIGEQAVFNREIFLSGDSSVDGEVFGYQEAWADYRYKTNRVSGEMRSSSPTPLDSWHLADEYSTTPALSSSWIQETAVNLDRVLAITSDVSDQFFCDIYVRNRCTRPMPMYSIPGLIDHH